MTAPRFKKYLLMLDEGLPTEAYEVFDKITEAVRAQRAYESDRTVKSVNLYAELRFTEQQLRTMEQQ